MRQTRNAFARRKIVMRLLMKKIISKRGAPAFLQLAFPWQLGSLLRRSSDATIENWRFYHDAEGPAR
jgi:hypothetical protein